MTDVRLVFLGTGTGEPSADRSASGLAFLAGERSVLIDAGDGVAGNWLRHVGTSDDLSAVILTHLHADHVSGLPYLLQGLHLSGREQPLRLYSPPGTYPGLAAWLRTVRLDPEGLGFEIQWRGLAPGEVRLGPVTVEPVPNTHLAADADGNDQSYSLLLRCGGFNAAYSSDLGGLSDLEPLLGPDLDVLIVEATHFPPEELVEYIGGRPPGRLVFTHIPEGFDAVAAVSLGLKSGLSRVEVASDGLEVCWA
jgi:ribonuclease Z